MQWQACRFRKNTSGPGWGGFHLAEGGVRSNQSNPPWLRACTTIVNHWIELSNWVVLILEHHIYYHCEPLIELSSWVVLVLEHHIYYHCEPLNWIEHPSCSCLGTPHILPLWTIELNWAVELFLSWNITYTTIVNHWIELNIRVVLVLEHHIYYHCEPLNWIEHPSCSCLGTSHILPLWTIELNWAVELFLSWNITYTTIVNHWIELSNWVVLVLEHHIYYHCEPLNWIEHPSCSCLGTPHILPLWTIELNWIYKFVLVLEHHIYYHCEPLNWIEHPSCSCLGTPHILPLWTIELNWTSELFLSWNITYTTIVNHWIELSIRVVLVLEHHIYYHCEPLNWIEQLSCSCLGTSHILPLWTIELNWTVRVVLVLEHHIYYHCEPLNWIEHPSCSCLGTSHILPLWTIGLNWIYKLFLSWSITYTTIVNHWIELNIRVVLVLEHHIYYHCEPLNWIEHPSCPCLGTPHILPLWTIELNWTSELFLSWNTTYTTIVNHWIELRNWVVLVLEHHIYYHCEPLNWIEHPSCSCLGTPHILPLWTIELNWAIELFLSWNTTYTTIVNHWIELSIRVVRVFEHHIYYHCEPLNWIEQLSCSCLGTPHILPLWTIELNWASELFLSWNTTYTTGP